MSASTSSKIGNCEPSPAGTCKPDWAIKASRPTVFKATVLPPVLGPVTTRIRNRTPRLRSIGTTVRSGAGSATGGTVSEPRLHAGRASPGLRPAMARRTTPGARAGTGSAGTGFFTAGSPRKKASSKGCLAARRTRRDFLVELGSRHLVVEAQAPAREDQVEIGHGLERGQQRFATPGRPERAEPPEDPANLLRFPRRRNESWADCSPTAAGSM